MHAVIFYLLHGISQQQAASNYVNWVEAKLHANREAYFQGPRTAERQRDALAEFDRWWAWLQSPAACGNSYLDEAGQVCLAERQAGGRWPWVKFYRDPIRTAGPVPQASSRASR